MPFHTFHLKQPYDSNPRPLFHPEPVNYRSHLEPPQKGFSPHRHQSFPSFGAPPLNPPLTHHQNHQPDLPHPDLSPPPHLPPLYHINAPSTTQLPKPHHPSPSPSPSWTCSPASAFNTTSYHIPSASIGAPPFTFYTTAVFRVNNRLPDPPRTTNASTTNQPIVPTITAGTGTAPSVEAHYSDIPSAMSTTTPAPSPHSAAQKTTMHREVVSLASLASADMGGSGGRGGGGGGHCVLRDDDVTAIAKRLGIIETTARHYFSSPDSLSNMRIADLKTIGNYLAEKKLFLGKLYGKKKEVQLKILKSIIWPNLVAQNPIASLPIPSVPPTAFQLSSFYAQIAPLGFLRRERELVAQTLQSGMNIPQAIVVPYTVRVALSHLLPLLEGESDVVKHQDKRNRAHLYLFSTTFGRVLDAKSVLELNSCRCNGMQLTLEPYEVNAGFQHIDITKCLNWGAIIEYQRRHEDSSVTDVLLHLEIPKRVFTQGYLALWKVRKLGVKELVAKVYLDTMNAYLDEEDPKAEEEVDEVALETMRRQSEAANEDLVARVERMFVSRVADTEGTKKDREREKAKKDQTGANDEGEIEMGDQTVSFLDPFVLSRIRHPARGKECKHRACFDLEAFLRFNERKANWQCACCSRMVTVESLIIDTKFKNYLNTYPNADRCIVHSDGTTSVPATNASLSSSTTSSTSSSSSPSRNSTPLSSDCATDAAAAAAAAAPARSSRKRKIGQIEVISLDDSEDEDEDAVRERRTREKWRSVGARRASPAKLPGVKDVVIVLDD